ncbi:epoxyqueuosine reductase QueH [Desulfofustis limnaeus]|jgi:predicted adenine nucleotide alpha hydrolase (AANH) superfamily ATPase|uniref:epoxyqueuosine reductase QueH n=1 Tax=Desulfofustis limnaeus TaxID=2740163 RepID=UPI0024E04021|nr:epoxyqueuosine reductase QueH [Desulfofustis limnaeus]
MNLLLHVCCAPCLLYPAHVLHTDDISFTCYFFNPNIHPFKEFKKRLDTFRELSRQRNYQVIIESSYGLKIFLRSIVFKEEKRCSLCHFLRMKKTFEVAASHGFDSVSSTLLYSRFQDHRSIKTLSDELSLAYGMRFYYRDFRVGWDQGVFESKRLSLYRQPYCGCVYSEQERYDKSLKKQ